MMRNGFWLMGGYARFVWPCVGFVLAVLGWNVWSARRYVAAAKRRVQRTFAMVEEERT